MSRLFLICLYGVYGGEWYCAVYASNKKEAIEKGRNKYNINNNTWKDFKNNINTPDGSIEIEFVFDEKGVSNLWQKDW